MRDDQIRFRLAEVNPWWKAAASGGDRLAWAAGDRTLRDRARFDRGYRARVLDDVATGRIENRLVVLRGPRRVGKSVVLKDTASALCARPDIDPRQVIYLPADEMRPHDIQRAAVLGRHLTRSIDSDSDAPRRRVWLLDEVTGIAGWTAGIKYLRDNTPFGDDTVVCTGSSWSDTSVAERDLMAGRAGLGGARRTRLLLPMRFRDVVAATRPDLPLCDAAPPWGLQSPAVAAAIAPLEVFLADYDLTWQAYLESGGFPRAVAEHSTTGAVSGAFCEDLAAWLHRDVDTQAPADSAPLLLAEIARRSTSPLNRTRTAADLGYPSRQTFDLRLSRLIRCFAALPCAQIDDQGRRVAGSQAKLYLADPLLAWLGHRLRAGTPAPEAPALTENALAAALAAAVDAAEPGRWLTEDAIGYRRSPGGGEVDFAPVPVLGPAGAMTTTPLESKWVTGGWRGDARAIENRYGYGVLATRNVLDFDNLAWAVPAPIVALLLG